MVWSHPRLSDPYSSIQQHLRSSFLSSVEQDSSAFLHPFAQETLAKLVFL
jgi:hypothetical protein